MDFTPYLQNGEHVIVKQRSERGNRAFVELAVCFTLWIICVACDCFFFGAMTKIRETTKVSNSYLFVLIPSVIIHVVPFAAWMVTILKKLSPLDEKWYAVTDKRIAVVTGVKPVNVCFLNLVDVTTISMGTNKVTVFYGEEKLVLNGLADAESVYDALDKMLFPDEADEEKTESDLSGEVENENNENRTAEVLDTEDTEA